MTYEEAKKRQVELHKIDIKRKLHRINPIKYPDNPPRYSSSEALDVAWTIVFKDPNYRNPFEVDSVFFNAIKNKKF